jgi:hypothetical protein
MEPDFDFLNTRLGSRKEEEADTPETSPEEYAEGIANAVASSLASTRLFEVVEVQSGIGQIHILGRVSKDKERSFVGSVVSPILQVLENSQDSCRGFVGKQFMLKYGTVKYAWVISFASSDLRTAASDICSSFESSVPRAEVLEAPLVGKGPPQSGGVKTGRRGASALS